MTDNAMPKKIVLSPTNEITSDDLIKKLPDVGDKVTIVAVTGRNIFLLKNLASGAEPKVFSWVSLLGIHPKWLVSTNIEDLLSKTMTKFPEFEYYVVYNMESMIELIKDRAW